ncbi:CPBP family intramembrane glutamic endopeptidase [Thermofilum pendens]|uniref:Abortive infection protein n=1 Tax=Thermofilum pendens (strain DSM 2475 / Hrk 5) TaxID=368408 RepID=A1RZW8_THEPD|nr:CPBP family intramembrane glutamic endopeptidase [Thermofilum pendens]ABL78748.1 Abortive infection protein [Thermofilum pendens Hrk 5]
MGAWRRLAAFLAIAYALATAIDVAVYASGFRGALATVAWGAARMWSVALAVWLADRVNGTGWGVRGFLGSPSSALKLYLLSPLVAYAALGVYAVLATLLGLFDFDAYVELLAKALERSGAPSALAPALAVAGIASAYLAAVTVNAALALGEELGWRGYAYRLLGGEPGLKSTLVVGVAWALWHAPATILLGYNYPESRLLGLLPYSALLSAATYPLLLATTASGSVLPAASLHGAMNALWGLTVAASRLRGAEGELLLGMGVLGVAAWAIVAVALWAVAGRRRRAERLPEGAKPGEPGLAGGSVREDRGSR